MSEFEPTRRWVLHIGAGALLTGFSGIPGEAAPPLPPGVYLASTDHVAHALRAAMNARPLANYSPQFFSAEELALLRRVVTSLLGDVPDRPQVIAEIVNWIDLTVYDSAAVRLAANELPPLHRALASAYYGIEPVRHLETFDAQTICRKGLHALAADARISTDEGLADVLNRNLGRAEAPAHDEVAEFLAFLKTRTFEGYYTSRQGLRELDYKGNSFYKQSPGCDHRPGMHA